MHEEEVKEYNKHMRLCVEEFQDRDHIGALGHTGVAASIAILNNDTPRKHWAQACRSVIYRRDELRMYERMEANE